MTQKENRWKNTDFYPIFWALDPILEFSYILGVNFRPGKQFKSYLYGQ